MLDARQTLPQTVRLDPRGVLMHGQHDRQQSSLKAVEPDYAECPRLRQFFEVGVSVVGQANTRREIASGRQ